MSFQLRPKATKQVTPGSPSPSGLCQAMLDRIAQPTDAYTQARLSASRRYAGMSANKREQLLRQLEIGIGMLRLLVWQPDPATPPDEWLSLHDRLMEALAKQDTLMALSSRG